MLSLNSNKGTPPRGPPRAALWQSIDPRQLASWPPCQNFTAISCVGPMAIPLTRSIAFCKKNSFAGFSEGGGGSVRTPIPLVFSVFCSWCLFAWNPRRAPQVKAINARVEGESSSSIELLQGPLLCTALEPRWGVKGVDWKRGGGGEWGRGLIRKEA